MEFFSYSALPNYTNECFFFFYEIKTSHLGFWKQGKNFPNENKGLNLWVTLHQLLSVK